MSDHNDFNPRPNPPSHSLPSSSRPPRPPSSKPRPRPRYFPPPVPRRPRSTSNVYIPPFRQRRIDADVPDPPSTSSHFGQSRAWIKMKKRINYIVNIVNSDNVALCAKALFRLNIVRARGLLVKKLLRHQLASPNLSPVFACLIAIIGSRLPDVAELLVTRLIAQLKDAYANQDRTVCFATARFIAHLFNQQVVTDLLLLEFLSTCTLDPSDGSIELAVVTLQECTGLLSEKSPRPLELIFQRLRQVLHDGDLSRRVQVMIEDLIAMRRKTLSSETNLDPRLDLLDEEDIITHLASLDDEQERDLELECDSFQFDPDFEKNERIYESIKRDILGAEADAPDFLLPFSPGNSNVSSKGKDGESDAQTIAVAVPGGTPSKDSQDSVKDMTEKESSEFRRTVYLTNISSLSSEEWAHKLTLLMRRYPGRERDLCHVIIECCIQEKTFLKPYGRLGQRFCLLDDIYVSKFEELFATHYATIHEFKVPKIINIANFYSFLFACDSLPWSTFQIVRIVESESTSSSRIFLKQLLQEMAKTMGKTRLKEKFTNQSALGNLTGLLPSDCAENAKYAIEFYKNIDLEYLAEGLEGILSTLPNLTQPDDGLDEDDSSSMSSSVSSDSDSSSSLSESSGVGEAIGEVRSAGGGSMAASLGSGRHGQRAASESASKRGAEESSLDNSHRPVKIRRRIGADPEPSEESRPIRGDDSGNVRHSEDYDRRMKADYSRRSDDEHYSRDNLSRHADGSREGPRKRGVIAVVGPTVRDDSDSDMDRKRNRLRTREHRRSDQRSSSLRDSALGGYESSDDAEKYGGVSRRNGGSRPRREFDEDEDMKIGRRSKNRSSRRERKKEREMRRSYTSRDDGSSQSDSDYHSSDDKYKNRRRKDQRMRERRYADDYDDGYSDRRESSRRSDAKRRSKKKEYGRTSRRIPSGRERDMSDSDDDRLSLRSRSRSRSRSPPRPTSKSPSPQRRPARKHYSGSGGSSMERYGRRPSERGEQASG